MTGALAGLLAIASLASASPPATAAATAGTAAAPVPGTITTWAGGTGEGPATNLAVRPDELAVRGPLVYIADQRHHLVRVLDTRSGELRTVAGNGDQNIYLSQTPLGDGGSASVTRIDTLTGVAVDSSGSVYFSDAEDDRIRRVDGSGIITTVAGGGHPPDGDADGDGLPATQATLTDVASLAFDPSGNLFAADVGGQRVRRIQTSGIIGKVAGGRCCSTVNPDGAPAVGADIHVKAVAVDATGHLYLANGFQVMAEGNPRIFSWGFNGLGQLGDGTTVDRPAPVRSLAYGEDVFAGGYHSFTSTEAWGYNNFGQLGTGSSAAFAPTPTLIVKPEVRFDTVAGGLFHNVALATDGSVYSWGWNGYGALGDGTTTARTVPTVIGGVSGAGAVAVGAVHSVIVR